MDEKKDKLEQPPELEKEIKQAGIDEKDIKGEAILTCGNKSVSLPKPIPRGEA